jgi:outer membrane lipoprotein carrier protein
MKRLILIYGWLAGSVSAAETAPDAGMELVDAFVNDVVTLAGDFEQSLVSAEGEIIEVTRGRLEIQRPDRFRWAYSEPYEQWLIADGLNIWSYDLDLEQVTVKPQADALANTPAMLLGGSDTALDQFEYRGTTVDDDITWVGLVPLDTQSGFVRVELAFIDNRLSRMVFFDNLEQTTYVTLENVSINDPIDAGRFEFSVPTDVDLVGRPAVAASTSE